LFYLKIEDHLNVWPKALKAITVFFLFLIVAPLLSEEKIIEEPKFTNDEKNAKQIALQLIGEIKEDINDTTFMAKPMSLATDNNGNIFVYDAGHSSIFKFDKNYRFINTFGGQGQGPGEFNGSDSGSDKLYFSDFDHLLYAADSYNHKIIVFDALGNHIKDIRTPVKKDFPVSYIPLLDKDGNFYVHSRRGGGVDVYTKNFEFMRTLLEERHYNRYLLYKPVYNLSRRGREGARSLNTIPRPANTYYDVTLDNRIIIYLVNASTVFVINNGKIETQFDIWPKTLLEKYRKEIIEIKKRNLKNIRPQMVLNIFSDKDDRRFFYIYGSNGFDNVYKYDIKGHLIAVLKSSRQCQFMVKRNGLFYGFEKNRFRTNLLIYKEKEVSK